jgi:hypothetical protein
MSSAGPPLHSAGLWAVREARCLSTLEHALSLLREIHGLPQTEVELNRHLYSCLLTATRELYPEEEIPPLLECNNQPDPDDQARARREQKRPDFQWAYLDRYESDPQRSSKQFVVECKRLGNPTRADWVLNANYIAHGIARFRDPEWAYAKRFASGAMIGYWQSMEGTQLLNEINQACSASSFPALVLLGTWNHGATSRFQHTFARTFEVSPFRLLHLWIDLKFDQGDGTAPSNQLCP